MHSPSLALTLGMALVSPAFAAPAGGLDLDVDSHLDEGAPLVFTVTGAQPGQTVYIGASPTAGSDTVCPPILGGKCIDLVDPVLLAVGRADGTGTFTYSTVAPPTRDGSLFHFQAAARGARKASSVSTVRTRYNPASSSFNRTFQGSANVEILGIHLLDAGRTFSPAGLFQSAYVNTAGYDVCVWQAGVIGAASAPPTPCADCEFTFDFALQDPAEVESIGDCLDILGFDPATSVVGVLPLGFDEDASYAGGAYGSLVFYLYGGTWYPVGAGYTTPAYSGYDYLVWGATNYGITY